MLKSTDNSYYVKRWLGVNVVTSSTIVLLIIFYVAKLKETEDEMIGNEDKLMNLSNFRYLIKNNICAGHRRGQLVILAITSYVKDILIRNAIRKSYPKETLLRLGIRRGFFLGMSNKSQDGTEEENRKHKDIIQGNFLEGKKNMTYAHVMALRWAVNHCSKAKYVIKMEIYVVADLYRLNSLLKKFFIDKFLAGYMLANQRPMRDPNNPKFLSIEEFPLKVYPDFLSGWFYVTNLKTIKALLKSIKKVNYIWIDDLFVTGILSEYSHIPLLSLNEYFTNHHEYLQCCVDAPTYICDFMVGPSNPNLSLMFDFTKHAKNCFETGKCQLRGIENSLQKTCIVKTQRKAIQS